MSSPSSTSRFSHRQKPVAGIALYALAVFFIILMNGFAKKASLYNGPIEILFYRGLVGLSVITGFLLYKKNFQILKTARIKTHIGRALFGNAGAAMVFWTYSLMPMADATAFLYTTPLLTTALSAIILKETVGLTRWGAVVTGFAGVILIAQPSGHAYEGYAVAVALAASGIGAFVGIFLRDLGRTEDALTTVFYFLFFGVLLSGSYTLFFGTMPNSHAILPLLGTGICSITQLLLKTQAYRWAEASALTPVFFTSIAWATLIGWLVWGDIPHITVIAGVAVIISANLVIIWRERYHKQRLLQKAEEKEPGISGY